MVQSGKLICVLSDGKLIMAGAVGRTAQEARERNLDEAVENNFYSSAWVAYYKRSR